MISVRLDKELEEKLNRLSALTKRPKSFFIKEALREYLDDILDALEAQRRVDEKKRELITLDEMKKLLNV
ncbi:MAG: CopG family transcriptional regulator [Epsilonproteobacteria bacterium]|nr:CopG family transcriptional regulator [Campylobacterota bacterium]NPA64002.1 ribbon-helix-helix protein, CopG family [Campylobacterota bacterium]